MGLENPKREPGDVLMDKAEGMGKELGLLLDPEESSFPPDPITSQLSSRPAVAVEAVGVDEQSKDCSIVSRCAAESLSLPEYCQGGGHLH